MAFKFDLERCTWGAEHELADWDTQITLPPGFKRSPDYTIVNSNGIAAQPNPKQYRYGGEINTPATVDIEWQLDCFNELQYLLETDVSQMINHRSNLHLHVRVPGLKQDLKALKKCQKYIHDQLPQVIDIIEPIPEGETPAEKKRERRRHVSHHTFLTGHRVEHQLDATTVQEFFEREVPVSKTGQVMWHAQPRCCVNLRQMLQTDTIEFRHFPGTWRLVELESAFRWVEYFIESMFNEKELGAVGKWANSDKNCLPKFPAFNFDREVKYQATAAHNGLKQAEIRENIKLILEGKFNGSEAEARAIKLTNGEKA